MLTPYFPYPLTSGGQIRSYNLLKKLAKKHQVTLFSFIRKEKETEFIKNLSPFCEKIAVFKRRRAWSLVNLLLAAVTPRPFLLSIYYSPAFKKAISLELNQGNYDLIHFECFYLMHNLPPTRVPILLVEQTIEYLVYQNVVREFPFWLLLLKPILYLDVLKIKLWEEHFWRRADRLVTMSDEDKNFIRACLPDKKIDVIANGVDSEFFAEGERAPTAEPTVLFVGQFRWPPNIDAALFLVQKIWPMIKEKVPQAKLWIVGRNPTPKILALAQDPNIAVEEVEDIRQVLSQAWVLLAPIRNGRGTKYKVLEAMASGLPVVTTPLGIEGIESKDKEEVLVAGSAEALASATIGVLTNPDQGRSIAAKAKELVSRIYNWGLISKELDRVYQEVGRAGAQSKN